MFLLGCGENLWRRFLPKYLQSLGAPIIAIGAFGTPDRLAARRGGRQRVVSQKLDDGRVELHMDSVPVGLPVPKIPGPRSEPLGSRLLLQAKV